MMKKQETANLKPIPSEKLGKYIKWHLKKIERHEPSVSVCPACGKVVETYDCPYAYDEKDNDVWFASVCPECGNIQFSKE